MGRFSSLFGGGWRDWGIRVGQRHGQVKGGMHVLLIGLFWLMALSSGPTHACLAPTIDQPFPTIIFVHVFKTGGIFPVKFKHSQLNEILTLTTTSMTQFLHHYQ